MESSFLLNIFYNVIVYNVFFIWIVIFWLMNWPWINKDYLSIYPSVRPSIHLSIYLLPASPESMFARLTWPEGFGAFMVNRCAVLWSGRDLWVETAHSHLPCFVLWRKTTPKKQRAAKSYKMAMNWTQVTQKKQQQAQVYLSTIQFYIYAYFSTF